MEQSLFSDPLILEKIKEAFVQHEYSFISQIGKGGFSVVFLAQSMKYRQNFVIKVVNNKNPDETESEIKALIKLDHPNIISIFEYFTDDKFIYIVLEYCPGGTLEKYIKQNGPLPKTLLYQVCAHLLSALNLCHSLHIAHRDIKPANILIDQYGRPKLADFGLSSEFFNGENTTNFGGSRLYMAPEIIQKKAYDAFKADIWALGVSFYQMASGSTPWPTENLNEIEFAISMGMVSFSNVRMDYDFVKIVKSMIEVNVNKRATLSYLLERKIIVDNMNSHISLVSKDAITPFCMPSKKIAHPVIRDRRASLVEIRKASSNFTLNFRRPSMHKSIYFVPTFSPE